MSNNTLGVWTYQDRVLVQIDYQQQMFGRYSLGVERRLVFRPGSEGVQNHRGRRPGESRSHFETERP